MDAHSQGCHVLEKLQGRCQMEKNRQPCSEGQEVPRKCIFLVNIEEERRPKQSVSSREWFH